MISAQRWRIYYRSGEDQVTERVIRDFVPEAPSMVHAICELRQDIRTFRLDRIEWAIDAETAEIIPDVWAALGLPSQAPPPLTMPTFTPVTLSYDQARARRNADKAALFNSFKYPVIAAIKKRQLMELFQRECFRCGAIEGLNLDHHIPQALGGRLVPGNIVLLCGACNRFKRAMPPERFYRPESLGALEPLLREQLKIFNFKLNFARWLHHPEDYLRSLGATEEEVEAGVRYAACSREETNDGIIVRFYITWPDNTH
jgi:hypothetical protein